MVGSTPWGKCAMPFLHESWNHDSGTIASHTDTHPEAVTDAPFGLLLAP